jgi:hypothetical protein
LIVLKGNDAMDGSPRQAAAWRMKAVAFLAICAPLTACVIGFGDSAARVAGFVVDEASKSHHGCRLELLHEENDKVLDYRHVEPRFLITFVLPTKPESYRLRISCPESPEAFISKPLELGDLRKTYDKPVDLGVIVLKRHK